MNDKAWDNYIRRVPGTFWGEEGRKLDDSFKPPPWKPPKPQKYTPPPAIPSDTPPVPHPASAPKRSGFSVVFAILGFFLAFGALYSEADPEAVEPLLAGVVGGYLAGKLYKLIIVLALIAFVIHLLEQP